MYKNNFYPLRTIVGKSIPISNIISTSPTPGPFTISIENSSNINETVNLDVYSNYLPDILKDGVKYSPMDGMATMPIPDSNLFPLDNFGVQAYLNIFKNPQDSPFPVTDSVSSIFGYQENGFVELQLNPPSSSGGIEQPNHLYSGRDRTYSFFILLKQETLVGGMCFSGYPYISSRIENTPNGMALGNFGLPREIRLTPLPSFKGKSVEELAGFQRSQFIDAEFAYTRQEIISHSGLNYLTVDPVKTNLFMLTVTDLPFITKMIDLDTRKNDPNNPLVIQGYKGFAIPWLYFFEYKEQTVRNARLHSGLLGVKPTYPHLPKLDDNTRSEDILRRSFPEYEFSFLKDESDEGKYILYTAHSCLGQRREFGVSYANLNYSQKILDIPTRRRKKTISECFVSDLLQPGEKTTLYIQQAEELERCIAGIKALFLLIPEDRTTERWTELLTVLLGAGTLDGQLTDDERNFAEDVLAYIMTLPPETNFCECIGLKVYEIDPPEGMSPALVDLSSKYATLLTDTRIDDFKDVIFSQVMRGIPFRKISTAKYFAVELSNLGQKPGQVAIHSFQLMRSANVSVQPKPARNQQVKALHYRIIGPSLADDFSKLGNEGFNFTIDRATAGQTKNVLYSAFSLLDLLHTGGAKIHANSRRRAVEFEKSEYNDNINQNLNETNPNFEERKGSVMQEGWRKSETGDGVRSKQSWLYKPETSYRNYSNQRNRSKTEFIYPKSERFKDLRKWFNKIADKTDQDDWIPPAREIPKLWINNGIWKGINETELDVDGLLSIGANPLSQIDPVLLENDLNTVITALFDAEYLKFTGGSNTSISSSITPLGVGISASLGLNPYPSIQYQANHGSQGAIGLQATETGYSFSQFKNQDFNQADSYTEFSKGEMKRMVTRKEVPNTDLDRIKGSEVLWQDKLQDIITGSIPLNIILPATGTKMNFVTADDSLRVRFNSGFASSIAVDFWFELTEEIINDDN